MSVPLLFPRRIFTVAPPLYLSVRFLQPEVELISFHVEFGVAGPGRGSHVGRSVAFVASAAAASVLPESSVRRQQLADGTGFRKNKKKKNRPTHSRDEAPCVYCAVLKDVLLGPSGCC